MAYSRSPTSGETKQLDFSQAMSDFKVMFPSMDMQVIETVLRSNNGSVDITIDHLLCLSDDTMLSPPSYNEATIPDCDFASLSLGARKSSTSDQMMDDDERIAIMLQDEEFVSQLRVNQAFIMSLRQDGEVGDADLSHFPSERSSSIRFLDEAAFVDRIKHMGKQSKKKFSQIASMFTLRRRLKPPPEGFSGGSGDSRDDSLLLIDADDDHHLTTKPDDESDEDGVANGAIRRTSRSCKVKGKYTSFG